MNANDVQPGTRVLYPFQTRQGCDLRAVTIATIVEYPHNRVLYFAEGGVGIVDRRATLGVPA
jgi:hypothetical protein